ncbi:CerR family C-terminal domain-containing protein [uncultured Desulfuromonas sp.]|uniref:CerR family C-terminal domain-containing protein n=1 Tax=uncultured Desulfuromonas sp. TaxID=181013 RepID=UPI002AAAADF1|nr:CerR family C-terminal domain-containing protein [uncultured Desulfuromonas sp.]
MKCPAKQRIEQAALKLFADKGFKATTIRDICAKSGVSVALVHYHYKNKNGLYEVLLDQVIGEAFDRYPMTDYLKPGMSAEQRLRQMIRLLLHRLIGGDGLGRDRSRVRLMARELTAPSPAFEKLFQRHIQPMILTMVDVVREFVGPRQPVELIRIATSVAGQCLYPFIAHEVMSRSGFTLGKDREEIERHAEHIYQFSLHGLCGLKEEGL